MKGLSPARSSQVSTTANPIAQPIPLGNLVPPKTAKAITTANKVAKQANKAQAVAKPHGKASGSKLFQKVAKAHVTKLISK